MMTKQLIFALLVSSSIFAGTVLARGYGSGDGPGQNYTDWSSGSDQSAENRKQEIDSLRKEKGKEKGKEKEKDRKDPEPRDSLSGSGSGSGYKIDN